MATMGTVLPYRQLVRSAARTPVAYVPQRTLTSSAIRYAQGDKPGKQSNGIFSSMKNWVLGGSSESKPKATRTPSAPTPREGELGSSSIFAEESASPSGPTPKKQVQKDVVSEKGSAALQDRPKSHLQLGLNPNPKAQLRWEKKMLVREIRKRGRVPKAVQISRSERESLSKSHWFKTSVKKLGPLARQIAGKNIDEAILQMRFSKKKAAQDVLGHLEHAKNVAMVRAGMGLSEEDKAAKPITVTLKSGERKKIEDPTNIYIEQAWVNRGPYGFGMDHRARGQINRLRPPATGLSVVLKEEKTRIREWEEREATALRKRKEKLWTQLPDRKITAQNQFYSW